MGRNNKEKSFEENFHSLPVRNDKGKNVANTPGKGRQENKCNVLDDVESVDLEVIKMLKDIMIVDQYLNKRIQPNCSVIRDWSQDMIKYFKRACEADREKERQYQDMGMNKIVEGIVKDVLEDDSLVTWNLAVQVDDISCVDEIFTKKLSSEQALMMVREVINEEVKYGIFDIRENKASAVKDFFDSRKLLGEINAIIISIVPKVKNVRTDGLNSLVNHNQCAFIQGRQIHDNIIIAQELLKGYNRNSGPKRCSLKIDIAKAYDNMTWEYLINITNLCFADDLLVLCHGDVDYMGVIKKSLSDFNKCQWELTRGRAKVAWKTMCQPKHQGGLGLKELGVWNETLLTKHLWNIATKKEILWVKWVNIVKLRGKSVWEIDIDKNESRF
ncbi:RNA-directed DNA polymerase, eukaryota, reverse transcriptase zinc-binding domain protein [Tanacetum coccineum]